MVYVYLLQPLQPRFVNSTYISLALQSLTRCEMFFVEPSKIRFFGILMSSSALCFLIFLARTPGHFAHRKSQLEHCDCLVTAKVALATCLNTPQNPLKRDRLKRKFHLPVTSQSIFRGYVSFQGGSSYSKRIRDLQL